jgi:hypothetical protein
VQVVGFNKSVPWCLERISSLLQADMGISFIYHESVMRAVGNL